MTDFLPFKDAVNEQFSLMAQERLYVTDVTKDELWDTYLDSFPAGTNNIFRERREYDCQCCRTFIRGGGNVVSLDNNLNLVSIWDIEVEGYFQVVADALSALVKSRAITGVFRYFQKNLGTDYNHEREDVLGRHDGDIIRRWDHFHFKLPDRFVYSGEGNPHMKSQEEKVLLERGLTDISIEAMNIVLELIADKSVYRLDEYKKNVQDFKLLKMNTDIVHPEKLSNYLWNISTKIGPAGRIKNSVVGTLLIDLSEDMELDKAVYRFEHKLDPERFKRPRAMATKGMIKKAEEKVKELGFIDSLSRRHAEIDDITINNVLFANRDAKVAMNVFDEMIAETASVDIKQFKKVEEVSVDTFVNDILPVAENVELLFENQHQSNLMTLVAPLNPHGENMLKWGNNFSWEYKGSLTDSSMRDLVVAKGGKVDGVLRFTIKWNDEKKNQNDFDAHCIEPKKGRSTNRIDFHSKGVVHPSSGMLDVDIVSPGLRPAVENIIYTDIRKMSIGEYNFLVHNYSTRKSPNGFTAEIEFGGTIHTFIYDKPLGGKAKAPVATVSLDERGNFKITKSLKSIESPQELWKINTLQFHKAKLIMNSPNHWDGEETGNKHLFFILEGCENDQPIRGFFNEFLNEKLTPERKVFEMLGERMKAEYSPKQLSGLGFSFTKRASVICRVSGSFSRTIKVNF